MLASMVRVRLAPLLIHQVRLLAQNRAACLVLMMFVVAAVVARLHRHAKTDDTCYVLYWRADAWVERLKAAVPHDGNGPKIKVAPVEQFVDANGLIQYPRGAHSIQLRPPDQSRSDWLVWYWYSGADPSTMEPAVNWFWNATQDHFGGEPSVRVNVSPLETKMPLLRSARLSLDELMNDSAWQHVLVWTAMFFCSCYLPTMSLASQREHGTVLSIATTPAGWAGVAWSIWLFHAGLACVMAAVLAAVMQLSPAHPTLWCTVGLTVNIYLSVAFALGSWCRSAVSAGCGVMLYLATGGLLAATSHFLLGLPIAMATPEAALLGILASGDEHTFAADVPSLLCLTLWAIAWSAVGCRSFCNARYR